MLFFYSLPTHLMFGNEVADDGADDDDDADDGVDHDDEGDDGWLTTMMVMMTRALSMTTMTTRPLSTTVMVMMITITTTSSNQATVSVVGMRDGDEERNGDVVPFGCGAWRRMVTIITIITIFSMARKMTIVMKAGRRKRMAMTITIC